MSVKIPENLKSLIIHNIEPKIPKIIHQTYISIETLPEHWKTTPDSWKLYHPDWEYKFWSDKDCRELVKKEFNWFLETFDNFEYNIQRADAIRYMILYLYGGLYVDMDIASIKPFDDLFYTDAEIYLLNTPNGGIITNCLMASKSRVHFWIDVLRNIKHRIEDPEVYWIGKHITVMVTTGPVMLNTMYNEHASEYKIYLLPKEFIFPSNCNICCEKPCVSSSVYTSIKEGCSWTGYDTDIYNFLLCNHNLLFILLAIFYVTYSSLLYANTL